ncbi:MAG TPA: cytochrome-c peroxidase [Deltaproteobacteria bacterium]|nr:cytochrome-c peroxidase [Deltaproteobacteria bacterium]
MRRYIFAVAAFVWMIGGAVGAAGVDVKEHFAPLPLVADNADNPVTPEKAALGKLLFLDPRLSRSGFISCNSCHNLATGGVDNLETSIGHGWQLGPRNAPTVFNAAILGSQFWDGRAKDVEAQAEGPILNPKEMAATEELVLRRLGSIPAYVEMFRSAFPGEAEPLTYKNVARAIAAFERTLLTPSRFDEYLAGIESALTAREVRGLELFVSKGCVACHNGAAVGGASFQRFDYGSDQGRYEVTKDEADRKVFRVAPLRNVELTYPYFHDGKVWSLEEAVKIMAQKQLGVELTAAETADIVAFLKSLTGAQPRVDFPRLPPSGEATPRPDVK